MPIVKGYETTCRTGCHFIPISPKLQQSVGVGVGEFGHLFHIDGKGIAGTCGRALRAEGVVDGIEQAVEPTTLNARWNQETVK